MREIGGYIEIEHNKGPVFHEDAIKLNCGRACLEYLIEAYSIKRIWLPNYLCDSVFERCYRMGVEVKKYCVHSDFSIDRPPIEYNDWLYLVNYYGQLKESDVNEIRKWHKNIICDYAQDFFRLPVLGVPTIYTCRKYFGVSDGAFLYTEKRINRELETDESRDRIGFLVGRYEKNASEFYEEYARNNEFFSEEKLKNMSKLTENMLRGIDYRYVENKRSDNWRTLHRYFESINPLHLLQPQGAFAYPFYHKKGKQIRKELVNHKIYIPLLWPNVIEEQNDDSEAYKLAENILPLPCDQRYEESDMEYLAKSVIELIEV